MAQKPFEYAAPVRGLISQRILNQWPAPSTAQCTINGKQYCVQDNLAQVVLWVNKKLMNKFGYKRPTTWQQWAALGKKVAKKHPGYITGTIGDSSAPGSTCGRTSARSRRSSGETVRINAADIHCTRMASLLDPLISSGAVPQESVFTANFAKKYGGKMTRS